MSKRASGEGGAGVELCSSGIPALDSILNGGLVEGRTYLVQGVAGTGKSLLGQHILAAGLDAGETVVYIHGEESRADILTNAGQLGVDIADAEFLDIGPGTDFFTEDISYDLVEPSAIESERFTQDIKEVIEAVDPERVLVDPITQLQYVERDRYQYRKRFHSLVRFLRDEQVTVITTRTTDPRGTATEANDDIASLSDGIINLYLDDSERRIGVPKHRGVGQVDGTHGLEIRDSGIEVYPRSIPDHENRTFDPTVVSTGDADLDELLGGGIERGSVTFISGPTGVGKSTVGAQLLDGVAGDGETALGYLFEESVAQFTHRAAALGTPIETYREEESVGLAEIEPLVRSAEEFAQRVIADVETHDPALVLIDGLSGFKLSVQGDDTRVVRRLHALARILTNHGVAVVITDEIGQLTGVPKPTSTNTSYIADNLVVLSYVELDGGLQRALGVVKKRVSDFDSRFHRVRIVDGTGLEIAGTFDGVRGVMSGRPTRAGDPE